MSKGFGFFKNGLLLTIFGLSIIYMMPNLFIDQPIIKISPTDPQHNLDRLHAEIQQIVNEFKLPVIRSERKNFGIVLGFQAIDAQLEAKEKLTHSLKESCHILVDLKSTTPRWLQRLKARPMPLGLDLKGGMHLILALNTDQLKQEAFIKWHHDLVDSLKKQGITYTATHSNNQTIELSFHTKDDRKAAQAHLKQYFPDCPIQQKENCRLTIQPSPKTGDNIHKKASIITINKLKNRLRGLGVAEPSVQAQGDQHIVLDLPGIQDMTRYQTILTHTARVSFYRVLEASSETQLSKNPSTDATHSIKRDSTEIMTSDAIIHAYSTSTSKGQPCVHIKVNPTAARHLHEIIKPSGNRQLAIVYQDNQQGLQPTNTLHTTVVNIASTSPHSEPHFQITGLPQHACDELAILLQEKNLPASIELVKQTTIGPQLGLENIRVGINAIVISFLVASLFMGLYYRRFGWSANSVLFIHLSLLIACLSIIHLTLTLPGIIGILLSVILTVHAQILLFERILEARYKGLSSRESIALGYQKSWVTLLDAHVALLIIALTLFMLGRGAIQTLALTLSIGILTSIVSIFGFLKALVRYS